MTGGDSRRPGALSGLGSPTGAVSLSSGPARDTLPSDGASGRRLSDGGGECGDAAYLENLLLLRLADDLCGHQCGIDTGGGDVSNGGGVCVCGGGGG